MNQEKLNKLANTIVNYSLHLKENSKVLVNYPYEARPLVAEIIKEAQKVNAVLVLKMNDPKLNARLAEKNTIARLELLKEVKEFFVRT